MTVHRWRAARAPWLEKGRDVKIASWALLMGMLAYLGFGLIFWDQWWNPLLGDYVGLALFAVFIAFYVFVVLGAALIWFPWKDSRK